MAELTYCINLEKFYEPIEIKPVLNDHIVKHLNRTYRAERWFKDDTHCYVFIDITMEAMQHKNPFAKKPTEIQEMINSKKLIITNTIYPKW